MLRVQAAEKGWTIGTPVRDVSAEGGHFDRVQCQRCRFSRSKVGLPNEAIHHTFIVPPEHQALRR